MLKVVFEGMSKRVILDYLVKEESIKDITKEDIHQIYHSYILGNIQQMWNIPKLNLICETIYDKNRKKIYLTVFGQMTKRSYEEKELRGRR